jgi:integrase
MKLKDHADSDGRKVWLTADEVADLLDATADTEQRIGLGPGARCGLRAEEVTDVRPTDISETTAGYRIRVWNGKGPKYRETPIPTTLRTTIETFADVRDGDEETPLVDRSTRMIQRWVNRAVETLVEETGDEGWSYLSPHDLRRS